MSTFWPDEHFAEMARLHGDGLSMAEVAHALNQRFGTRYTRYSVQGKIERTLKRVPPPADPMPPERLARLQRVATWDQAARNALTRYQRSLA